MSNRIKKERIFRIVALFSLVLSLLLSTASCASKGLKATAKLEDVVAEETGSKQEIKELNDKLFASVGAAPQPKDYLLGEGDLLQISVFESEELKTETRISSRGFVTLPLLGPVEVKGLTTREGEQKIEDLYRANKFIRQPHVSVFVKEHVSGKITLMGAVKKPGTVDCFSRRRLLDVLALAEGLSEKAGRSVQVRRAGEDPAYPSTFMIDLDDMLKRGQTELNIPIKGGDVIYVPEAGMVYVDGAVRRAGNYPITQSMTVQQAIVTAGGFARFADDDKIKLVRAGSSGKREIIEFAIKDIEQGSGHALVVKDGDVIFVETATLKSIMYGLRLTGLGGIVGIGYDPPSQ